MFSNDTCHGPDHWTGSGAPLRVRSVKGLASSARTLPHFVFGPGRGEAATAAVLLTCGRTFPLPRWYPRYWIFLRPITHFFGLAVSPARLSDCSTDANLLHMLQPGVTVDDDVIQVGRSILSVRQQHAVHQALKRTSFHHLRRLMWCICVLSPLSDRITS